MKPPRVSVIIPTYRDWDRLRGCLKALSAQTLPTDYFEILVANNDPATPRPDDFVLPDNATVVDVSKPGSYAARNAALGMSKGEILAFTDSDCVPRPSWLAQALETFEKDPDVSRIAGGVTLFVENGYWNAAALYDRTFMLQQKRFAAAGKAATANAFARREVFDAIGPFKQDLLTGGDHEWSLRAQQAGYDLSYCADIVIDHPARNSFGQILRKVRRFAGGSIAMKRQRGDKVILPHLDKLLVPVRRFFMLQRSDELTAWEGVKVWVVLYAVRIAFVAEQFRLVIFQGEYERR